MPKKQPFAAKLARQIQAATGLAYTDCIKMYQPGENEDWIVLARELRAAGLVDTADNLLNIAVVSAESAAWLEAVEQIESAFYDIAHARVKRVSRVCMDAFEAVLSRAGFEMYSFDTSAEVYHCAFLALARAGAMPDGRALARAALDVFHDDPLYCSDVVRSRGRAPFTYETAASLTGPDTPFAIAARQAARAVAAASAVRTGGDEGWYEAAEHMVEAVWHGSAATGLPPLHESREHRDFFEGEMGGILPTGGPTEQPTTVASVPIDGPSRAASAITPV
ncbi:hypothetical protein [Streptomyces coerulescens]|uniref:Uncharacterized protein n=1 Tax=Streptomyces coerulescens TaxID=29304 RepID=A0ABW0CUY3_STRCD